MPRQVKGNYARRFIPGSAALVEAIQALLQVTSKEDPQFLARGLELLVEHMRADHALLVTLEGTALATQWWFPDRGVVPAGVPSMCRWLLDNPFRTLVLRDIPKDDHWRDDPDLGARGIRAAAGATLQVGGRVKGIVFLHYGTPHSFRRTELALLSAVAGYLSRILEIETLKVALSELENSLAITKAVVEDSSIQDPTTDLPTLRYLDTWLKANLPAAAREKQVMTVAQWSLRCDTAQAKLLLQEVAESVRGGDLLVSMGHDRFLLVLQRTPKGLGQVFLSRLRQKMGSVPMGATLWMPGQDDLHFESVYTRLDAALEESHALCVPDLAWRLSETGRTLKP